MDDYKIIACDLDGTLIATDMTLSRENCEAIKELTEQGVLVVPTTGRTICEMEEVYNLPEIRYVIYSNGTGIIDKKTGEKFFFGFDEKNSCFIFDVLDKFDTFIIVHKDGKTYADREKMSRYGEYNFNRNTVVLVNEYCKGIDNFGKQFRCDGVESIIPFFRTKEDKEACRIMMSQNPDLNMVEGTEYNFEIFFKDAGKGSALKVLAEKLGMEMKNVITVGDSDNDRQMTEMAGLGLAAKNCCESLKEVADEIICSNDEHVMQYIKKYYFT